MAARVDPAPAATHAAVLVRRGMSAQDIADASGIAVTLPAETPQADSREVLRRAGGQWAGGLQWLSG